MLVKARSIINLSSNCEDLVSSLGKSVVGFGGKLCSIHGILNVCCDHMMFGMYMVAFQSHVING